MLQRLVGRNSLKLLWLSTLGMRKAMRVSTITGSILPVVKESLTYLPYVLSNNIVILFEENGLKPVWSRSFVRLYRVQSNANFLSTNWPQEHISFFHINARHIIHLKFNTLHNIVRAKKSFKKVVFLDAKSHHQWSRCYYRE